MNVKEEMMMMVNELNYHTLLYNNGTPEISDKAWDEKYFRLVDFERSFPDEVLPNSPTRTFVYQTLNNLNKVKHNHWMGSLDKTKDMHEFINYFVNIDPGKDVVGMVKLDGLTCSLRYVNGKLVSAETRGNGDEGEDILHNAWFCKGIPKRIQYMGELIIDGEVICDKKTFEENFANDYKNPRNFASGSIRLLSSAESESRKLTFVAWNVVKGFEETNSLLIKLGHLEDIGFFITPITSSLDWDWAEFLQDQAESMGYPIDGLVGRFDDVKFGASLGRTDKFIKAAYAFKFYDEEYETRLKYIEWSMGRTGVLTPVAVFEPIDIDGTTVERASLHNYSVMLDTLGEYPYKGEPLKIFKANMIIPQVADVPAKYRLDYGDIVSRGGVTTGLDIEYCPVCGQMSCHIVESDSGVKNVICDNPQCEGKLINVIDHFVGKKGLDVKGLSKATIEKLIDRGWLNSRADVFKLHEYQKEWQNVPGFGPKSVSNILNAIETSRNSSLDKFIASLGIPLIGNRIAKILAAEFGSWDSFKAAITDKKYNFDCLDGFGYEMNRELKDYDYTEADEIVKLLNFPVQIDDMEMAAATKGSCDGLTVVITGKLTIHKNRAQLKDRIEGSGGRVTDSVTSKTNILINNDINSTSSKNKKAQSLGIPIMTEDEFIRRYF